ncbi:WD40 repeat domain-containing protein [Thermosipho atlanticus]|uniref:WD40 repeat n=1 Tax=Thermosipho atlanticus DSM 15807 TaxID=1123380 RepID=A0A1M5RA58_9BACT|nr:hypothetical protein [Thermosipho atlanticus]SHH23205.1 WD40 repeat [Thermosipho atlanticus DSM 15807]
MKILVIFFLSVSVFLFSFSFSLFGHHGAIWQLQVDKNLLYSSASDGIVNIWNIRSKTLLLSIYSHNSWARALAVDDKYIIVGGYKPDGNLKIYDKVSGKFVKSFSSKGSIFTIYTNSNYIVFGGSDNKVYIIDKKSLKLLTIHAFHERWIRDLVIINNQLISCGDDGKVIFYDINNLKFDFEKTFKGRIIKLLTIENKVYAVSSFGIIYDIEKENEVFKIENITTAYADENHIYIGTNIGELYILDHNFQTINYIKIAIDPIISITSSSNNVFIGTSSGKILQYNLLENSITSFLNNFSLIKKTILYKNQLYVLKNTGSLISYNTKTGEAYRNIINQTNISNFFINNDQIYYSSNEYNEYKVYDSQKNVIFESENDISLLFKIDNYVFIGTYGFIYIFDNDLLIDYIELDNEWPISFQINAKTVKIGTNTGKIIEYSLNDFSVKIHKISNNPIIKILNNYIVTFNGEIFENDNLIFTFETNIFDTTMYNKDLILGTNKELIIFNTITHSFSKFEISFPIVSLQSNEFLYASLSNGDIMVFDSNFNEYGKLAENEAKIVTVDISSNGKYIVTGGADKKIKIWKIENGKLILIKTFTGHNDWIRTIKIVDQKFIISGSSDNTVKIWNFNGRLLKTLSYHTGYVWSLEYKDGVLYSGGWDNKLFAYNLNKMKVIFSKTFKQPITHLKIYKNSLIISFINGDIIKLNLTNLSIEKFFSTKSIIWNFDIFNNILGVGDEKGFCYLINLENNKLIRKFQAHRTTIFNVKLWQNKIITASSDNTIKIFDFEGNLKGIIKDFSLSVLAVAIDPARNYIITSSGKDPIILQIP